MSKYDQYSGLMMHDAVIKTNGEYTENKIVLLGSNWESNSKLNESDIFPNNDTCVVKYRFGLFEPGHQKYRTEVDIASIRLY